MLNLLNIDFFLMQLEMQVLGKPYPCLGFDCLNDVDTASYYGIVIDESYVLGPISIAEFVHVSIKER